MALKVRVITPDRTVLDDSVEEVILPSSSGQVGILSGHAPLLTALESGVIRVRTNGWENIAITDGFAEVEANEVKVLVNAAAKGQDIDLEEARQAFEAAQAQLEQTDTTDRKAVFDARKELKRTRARYMAAGGMA
ncbi:ATP synthase F1, epsilon subunit [[Synechococcus] sp. NIES-970]|uniref:ATP synthase F1 subunit epsilon n=1 Tax=Picosynechococcus sp. NKBG15041c TaxID=1407650 RepID=UPI000411765B|nr:ATP synthase F1 subunit epsilon [Picosynechococcus sp. NKBG15041c]BAW95826.1 ATP synthase F1, epsilon subunit [[Synechococcus] sp. NIES-970]